MASTWVPDFDPSSDFSLANIPFGIITTPDDPAPHVAVAIGSYVLDLKVLAAHSDLTQLFPGIGNDLAAAFSQPTLNAFAQLGRPVHRQARAAIQDLLSTDTRHPAALRDNPELSGKALIPQWAVRTHLPMEIGDYTDFYAGYHHAHAVGAMFRGADHALQPNYLHLPVGYHGRASSVVVSGTPVRRPVGQQQVQLREGNEQRAVVTTGPTRKLDFELELGCFVARGNGMGRPVSVDEADEGHIFGYVLLNDWSARDVQAWEYVPLGPFNGKNFATTVSPWVVLADALEPFRARPIENPTELQPYLRAGRADGVFDIRLEVDLTSECRLASHQSSSFPFFFPLSFYFIFLFFSCSSAYHYRVCPSGRGRHDHHRAHQLQAPGLVVPADDCAPHARRVPAAHGRPARLGHHQRARRAEREGQPAGDDGERQARGAAGRHGRAHLPQGRRHGHAARLLWARRGQGRLWRVQGDNCGVGYRSRISYRGLGIQSR